MQALELCVKYNVPITEEMAEGMTPAKTDDEVATAHRIQVCNYHNYGAARCSLNCNRC